MLPRVLKYSGANFWDLKEDQVDWEEMRNAYRRATQDDIVIQLQALLLEGAQLIRDHADEIERLRKQVRELQSEIQRLEKLANYGQ